MLAIDFSRESAPLANQVVMVRIVTVAVSRLAVDIVNNVDNLLTHHSSQFAIDGGEAQPVTVANGLGVKFTGAGKPVDAAERSENDRTGLMRHEP